MIYYLSLLILPWSSSKKQKRLLLVIIFLTSFNVFAQTPDLDSSRSHQNQETQKQPHEKTPHDMNQVHIQILSPEQSPIMQQALKKLDQKKQVSDTSKKKQVSDTSKKQVSDTSKKQVSDTSQRSLRARLKSHVRASEVASVRYKNFVKYPLTEPLPIHELKTTSCKIFLSNIESKLQSLKHIYTQIPNRPSPLTMYAEALYSRAQLYHDLEGIASSAKLVDEGLKKYPKNLKLHLLRAQIAMTLH